MHMHTRLGGAGRKHTLGTAGHSQALASVADSRPPREEEEASMGKGGLRVHVGASRWFRGKTPPRHAVPIQHNQGGCQKPRGCEGPEDG